MVVWTLLGGPLGTLRLTIKDPPSNLEEARLYWIEAILQPENRIAAYTYKESPIPGVLCFESINPNMTTGTAWLKEVNELGIGLFVDYVHVPIEHIERLL